MHPLSRKVTQILRQPGFAIVSEMRNPRQHSRSLLITQGVVVAIFIVIGVALTTTAGPMFHRQRWAPPAEREENKLWNCIAGVDRYCNDCRTCKKSAVSAPLETG